MLESIIICGLVIQILEIIKVNEFFKTKIGKLLIPIISVLLCAIINVLNYNIFNTNNDITLNIALKDGIILGALTSGIYAIGKKAMNKGAK